MFKDFIRPQCIEKLPSQVNGEIEVWRFVGEITVKVDGVTQSGGLMTSIWKKTLRAFGSQIRSSVKNPNVLLLGLGAGASVKAIMAYFPTAQLTALEYDPAMVALSRRYFKLDTIIKKGKLNLIEADVFTWLPQQQSSYDLILIDLYQGEAVPESAQSLNFLKQIRTCLNPGGMVIFNRLVLDHQLQEAALLVKRLEQVYSTVSCLQIHSNWMLCCR